MHDDVVFGDALFRQPLKYTAHMRQMIGSPLMARPVQMNRAAVLPGARNIRIVKETEHLARIEVGSDLDIYPIGCHGFPTGRSKSLFGKAAASEVARRTVFVR